MCWQGVAHIVIVSGDRPQGEVPNIHTVSIGGAFVCALRLVVRYDVHSCVHAHTQCVPS